jgi:hypothetical protein
MTERFASKSANSSILVLCGFIGPKKAVRFMDTMTDHRIVITVTAHTANDTPDSK